MRPLAAILGGLLFAASFAPLDLAWLGWVAFAPLLLALRGERAASAALLGALFALATVLALVSWLPGVLSSGFDASWLGAGAVWISLGLSAVPAAAAYAAVIARVPPTHAAYVPVAALSWLLVELSWESWFPRLPWVTLGASQIDTSIAMLAAVTGVHGVSAAMVGVSALLVQATDPRGRRPAVASAASLVTFVGIGLWAAGPGTRQAQDRVRVALVQPALPMSGRRDSSFERRTIEVLLQESEGTQDAELVIWPENAFLSAPSGARLDGVQSFVDRRGVHLLAGGRKRVDAGWITAAFLFLPHAAYHVVYVKRHLLPLAEDVPAGLPPWLRRALGRLAPSLAMRAGSGTPTQAVGGRRIGLSICYEATLPFGSDGLLLVNLVNDGWYDHTAGAAQHLALARWRAIESGATLVRAASTGISAIVLPDGSIETQLGVGSRGVLVREVELSLTQTLFEKYGSIPALLFIVAVPIVGLTRRSRDSV